MGYWSFQLLLNCLCFFSILSVFALYTVIRCMNTYNWYILLTDWFLNYYKMHLFITNDIFYFKVHCLIWLESLQLFYHYYLYGTIISFHFTFNLFVSLILYVSGTASCGIFFLISVAISHFWLDYLIKFNVTIDMVGFMPNILLYVFYMSYVFFVVVIPLFLLYCLLLQENIF